MAEEKSCGPSSVAKYGDFKEEQYQENGIKKYRYKRTITISGTGKVETLDLSIQWSNRDNIIIQDGITELGDECFNKHCVDSVVLPKTLKKIGNNCFTQTNIKSIDLPEGLEFIGNNNFPYNLQIVNIPVSLKHFPFNNVARTSLNTLKVPENHESYIKINSVVYNKDKTEALFCERDKSKSIALPTIVKKIGDYCFHGVKNIPIIIIPPSVTSIGDYAMAHLTLKRLVIPNTVSNVGEGCFYNTKVEGDFHFSQSVTELPEKCFSNATFPNLEILRNIRIFGKECLSCAVYQRNNNHILRLEHAVFVDDNAFKYNKNFKIIEIYPCLKHIGKEAFYFEWDKKGVTVRCLSYAPPALNDDAFMELKEPVLLVPEGTKSVYSQSGVWGAFVQIEEVPSSKDGSAESLVDASPEIYKCHLKGLYESLSSVDRDFVSATLVNQLMNCTVIDNEESYHELVALLTYNRMFTPPIIPDYEQMVEVSMTDEYKLKLVEDGLKKPYLLNIGNRRHRTLGSSNRTDFPEIGMSTLPVLSLDKSENIRGLCEVESHFTDIQKVIENELEKAQSVVRVAVSWFTNYRLLQLVKRLAERGVHVELVINNDAINNGGYCLDFSELLSVGVDMCLVEWPDMIHHKFCIIDGMTVITGSYNWTRFSSKNYENIVVIRDELVAESFGKEFKHLQECAKHQHIKVMPEAVPPRAEYDRYAFKQYVTEDLDAAAKDVSDDREKITKLHRAVKLNGEYMKKLAPTVEKDYQEEFRILDMQDETVRNIVEMVESTEGKTTDNVELTGGDTNTKVAQCIGTDVSQVVTNQQVVKAVQTGGRDVLPVSDSTVVKQVSEKVTASQLYMAVDVSGSMSMTFSNGHVKRIVEKALSAALTLAADKGVSLWIFGDTTSEMGQVKLEDMSAVSRLSCQNSGTQLNSFVNRINSTLPDGALVLVLTDDDSSSIRGCIDTIKQRSKVYWQFLSYDRNCTSIETALSGLSNASLAYVSDYATIGDKELTEAMLGKYIAFRIKE